MTSSVPPSGRTGPASAEIKVVLPAPFGPSRPKTPLADLEIDAASACRLPYCLMTPLTRIAGTVTEPAPPRQTRIEQETTSESP